MLWTIAPGSGRMCSGSSFFRCAKMRSTHPPLRAQCEEHCCVLFPFFGGLVRARSCDFAYAVRAAAAPFAAGYSAVELFSLRRQWCACLLGVYFHW